MITDFYIISGETVPATYNWDIGIPFTTTPTIKEIKTVTSVISGYAPGLRVAFQPNVQNIPTSTNRTTVISSDFIWNFGDYYNDIGNEISMQCPTSPVEHTYVMPGFYEVSLTTIVARELIPDPIFTPRCYGKHRQGWFWGATTCDVETATTWNDTRCNSDIKPKWWNDESNCFGEYCKYWSWWATDKEDTASLNPVRWFQTRRGEEFTKKWDLGVNAEPCEQELQSTFDVLEQTTIKQIVLVVEKPPVANILPISQLLTGQSPLEITLSPKKTQTGSFPIDKIVWDFGDGTPTVTVTRYNPPQSDKFIYTNTFFDDPSDPRNYDIKHTYTRSKANYSMFYPSLTCYSSNTGTADNCSITVGPILLEVPNTDYELVALNTSERGLLYGIDFNNSINFLTPTIVSKITQKTNLPTSTIRQVKDGIVTYFGNTGEGYSIQYSSRCDAPYAPRPVLDFLILEQNTTPLLLEDETLIYK